MKAIRQNLLPILDLMKYGDKVGFFDVIKGQRLMNFSMSKDELDEQYELYKYEKIKIKGIRDLQKIGLYYVLGYNEPHKVFLYHLHKNTVQVRSIKIKKKERYITVNYELIQLDTDKLEHVYRKNYFDN